MESKAWEGDLVFVMPRGMFKLVSFSKMYKLLREPWTYMNKPWKTFFLSFKLPGSGKFVRLGSRSCCRPSWLVCSGRARGHGLGAWVSRSSNGSLATLGVSSFSGLVKFCFGSQFPVKDRHPVDQRFLSLLQVAGSQVSLTPACPDLGLIGILEGGENESCKEEKCGQAGSGSVAAGQPLLARSLSK